MPIVITLLTVFLVMVSLLLVLITLMQRPKQEGLGAAFGGGMMNDTFGAQTTDVLQKATIWLTVAFFGAAILLTILNTRHFEKQRNVGNVLEGVKQTEPFFPFQTPSAIPSTDPKEVAPETEAKDETAKPAPAKTAEKDSKSASPVPGEKADAGKDKAAGSESEKADKSSKADAPKSSDKEKDKK